MVKNIFFEKKILVIWKYAKMHQNMSLTTQEAVLSSRIEGTQATLQEVLRFEADEAE